jgi:hypothetical protein
MRLFSQFSSKIRRDCASPYATLEIDYSDCLLFCLHFDKNSESKKTVVKLSAARLINSF